MSEHIKARTSDHNGKMARKQMTPTNIMTKDKFSKLTLDLPISSMSNTNTRTKNKEMIILEDVDMSNNRACML